MTIPDELRKAVEASVEEMRQPPVVANLVTLALITVAEFGNVPHEEDTEAIRRHIDVIFQSIDTRTTNTQTG